MIKLKKIKMIWWKNSETAAVARPLDVDFLGGFLCYRIAKEQWSVYLYLAII